MKKRFQSMGAAQRRAKAKLVRDLIALVLQHDTFAVDPDGAMQRVATNALTLKYAPKLDPSLAVASYARDLAVTLQEQLCLSNVDVVIGWDGHMLILTFNDRETGRIMEHHIEAADGTSLGEPR